MIRHGKKYVIYYYITLSVKKKFAGEIWEVEKYHAYTNGKF
jgi:hypothetical protein